jgi:YVTN family beta-propeller protein
MVPVTTPRPPGSADQLFIGGAGGTAVLSQSVPISLVTNKLAAATRYYLSAALGGYGKDQSVASVQAEFLNVAGRRLGVAELAPVSARERRQTTSLLERSAKGVLPPGTARAELTLTLASPARDYNGPNGSTVGFNYAMADDLELRLSMPARAPAPLTPPRPAVPRFDHVFLIYLENQDYHAIVGNKAEAPFINSLLPRSSLLADMFAEEHPSDGNYLAFAGGSTFGVPLDDPAEENSMYTINTRNIGDLIVEAHETWKAYLQSANGPCDNTVHEYYWDDDLPFLYFKDIRENLGYCDEHVVPLRQYEVDLKEASTTPNFAWIGADDCYDMEGCGISAGDSFVRQVATELFDSPAWRTQPSLLIITWDEDGQDGQHPAQRIPTIIVGSRFVRAGYISHQRYSHYSLLRTTEAALGLRTLTRNDLYASPVDDVFTHSAVAEPPIPESGPVGLPQPVPLPGGSGGPFRARSAPSPQSPVAYVADSGGDSVTPLEVTTGRAERPITVGNEPDALALAPDQRTLYVANAASGTVTPIDTENGQPEGAVKVGSHPDAIAVTPNGLTAYVANFASASVTAINTTTGRAERPIPVGQCPSSIAITPDGKTALVVDWASGEVTPIYTDTDRAGPAIKVGSYPVAVAISPNGRVAYVVNFGSNTVSPIDIAAGRAGPAIPVGAAPNAIAVLPSGKKIFVVNGDSGTVTPIDVVTDRAQPPIPVGSSPEAIALSPNGTEAYVVNTVSGTVTPIDTVSNRPAASISVGSGNYPQAIGVVPGMTTAEVLDNYAGEITPLDLVNDRAGGVISLGETSFPLAFALAR